MICIINLVIITKLFYELVDSVVNKFWLTENDLQQHFDWIDGRFLQLTFDNVEGTSF